MKARGAPVDMEGQAGTDSFVRFQQVVADNHAGWLARAERIVRDRDEAEDVVQDTIALVWQQLAEHDVSNLPGYIGKAVQLNALKRRARRRQMLPLDEETKALVARAEEDVVTDSLELDAGTLESALQGLPETQQ